MVFRELYLVYLNGVLICPYVDSYIDIETETEGWMQNKGIKRSMSVAQVLISLSF